MYSFALLAVIALQCIAAGHGQEMETITGTIYCDNSFTLYINGELIAEDPTTRHNAVNVSFQVASGEDITFAIDAMDLADQMTGLEFDNRCVGDGGLRAMFSNGVVTNDQWVCTTYLYGPVNWKECFAAQTVREVSQQLHPVCINDTVPPLVGCVTRSTERPEGWSSRDFDDTRWEYAYVWPLSDVGYGLPPADCRGDPDTYVSSELDSNGVNLTCQNNIDWGSSEFIWRPDLDLDNHILCRYVLRASGATRNVVTTALWGSVLLAALLFAF